MNDLEREYRRALARYPRAWRRDHEEALLGVLLDKAEAEGRRHISRADRRDLTAHGTRLHVLRALPYACFTVAALALAFLATMVLSGTPLDGQVLITPPAIPAPPIGGSYRPLFVLARPAWVLFTAAAVVLLVATAAGTALVRRSRRAR